MSKAIKVIDLINMQYKNEKMPKNIRIKYSFVFDYYTYNEEIQWYETADRTTILDIYHKLDYEVEIIEEQEEIDIQSIEDIKDIFIENSSCGEDVKYLARKYNEILKWAKQLDKEIKEK